MAKRSKRRKDQSRRVVLTPPRPGHGPTWQLTLTNGDALMTTEPQQLNTTAPN